MRRLLLALVWVLLAVPGNAQTIRHIEIERRPVFDEGDLPAGVANLMNSLHVLTVESVIRRDLLVHEGEPYDSFLVAESARILRSRRYLGDIIVEITDVGSDSVDLKYITRDLWTLEMSLQPGGGGGAYSVDFSIADDNFRGRGETFEVGYNVSDRRSSGRVGLVEPAFVLPHLEASVAYAAHGEGNYFFGELEHPIWAITVPWQYDVSVQRVRDNHLFYKQNHEAFTYPYVYRQMRAGIARAWGRRTRFIAGVGFEWERSDYDRLRIYQGVDPALVAESTFFEIPDRERVMPTAGVRLERFTFPQVRFLDLFGRTEDFPNGAGMVLRAGKISADLGSSVSRNLYAGEFRAGAVLAPVYANLRAELTYETDFDESPGSHQLSTVARVYVKPALRHTIALRAVHEGWYRANRLGQMFLGALSGVRGLTARARDGTRIWYANAEYRYFSPLQILTLGVGGVVFADVGQVWNRGGNPHFDGAQWSYGAGLRLGLLRTAGDKVFRLDLARGPDGWVATFGTQMYFSFDLKGPMGI